MAEKAAIISAVCAVIAVFLSVRIYVKDEKYKKFKSRPVLYIRSCYENGLDKYIEIEVKNIKSEEVKEIEFNWIGDEVVELICNKILRENTKNIWDYRIILNTSKVQEGEDVIGKILVECTTVYDEKVTFKKEVEIYSKYYPMVEEYNLELKSIVNTTFDDY